MCIITYKLYATNRTKITNDHYGYDRSLKKTVKNIFIAGWQLSRKFNKTSVNGPGARFSNDPVTKRARNHILKSESQEK